VNGVLALVNQAVKFCNTLQKKYNVGLSDIINSKSGCNGGTFAHWQLALAYAKYLSPEFTNNLAKVKGRENRLLKIKRRVE